MYQTSTDRVVVVVDVGIIGMKLEQLDFHHPVFLTLCHQPCILVNIGRRSRLPAGATLLRVGILQQLQLVHRGCSEWVASKQCRMKALWTLYHLLLIQMLLLLLKWRKRKTRHAKYTRIISMMLRSDLSSSGFMSVSKKVSINQSTKSRLRRHKREKYNKGAEQENKNIQHTQKHDS